jgi:uncharacterized nucleotidyltransferase DUF6036
MAVEEIERALDALGRVLAARGRTYEVVVIGGSALLLLGIIKRPTRDVDVLALIERGELVSALPIPEHLAIAAADVAAFLRLDGTWLNGGPSPQIQSGLPAGFQGRLEERIFHALVVQVASRLDHIHLKLFAAVDHWPHQGKHMDDLRRLVPSPAELAEAARWVRTQDIGPDFSDFVSGVLRVFGVDDEP